MLPIELACGGVLLVYILGTSRDRRTLMRAAIIVAGAWLGEDTCIRAYRFYGYAPGWHLWLDQVPLTIVLVWPAVVLSARTIASRVARAPGPAALAAVTGCVVTFDAALIEPIAVHAHLWSWTEPGLFGVPVIGILGWGFYAAAITWVAEALPARGFGAVVAAALTHVALFAAWWGAFRWISGFVSPWIGTLVIASISVAAACGVVWRRLRLPPAELFSRAVATVLFAVLLARDWDRALVIYAVAFTLPHLVLCVQSLLSKPILSACR